ncbi:MAG: bifunctional histidinol-phosphatase/imidazoleglycerol-phosphate dehydratase HisB [Gammaproteobacteria bacterium]|nr:MAG: bifunctional histidinol-phosphatase/imidazoleglycerol-phosphate dehydratase HisB [Gammaproteobacteria bacterium]
MSTAKIAFLDRDGTLILEPADEQVDRLDKVALVEGVIPALLRLRAAGYGFVMVSNQDGLGTASFPEADFRLVQDFVLRLFASQGLVFREVFICPHRPADGCACRKPRTGLLRDFLAATPIDRSASVVIGDRETDLELAANLGLRGLRLDPHQPGAWAAIAHELVDLPRRASIRRETRETRISCTVDLDAEQPVEIRTGIAFFDHMLEQLARHGGFALQLRCDGDLHVDEHHTVEDTALVIGEALRRALGDKRGIGRYGFVLPMDEAQAQVAIDLSGRAHSSFEGIFPRNEVGGLPTEMVPHFFRSLADSLGAAIQIKVAGENSHHMVESCFKATGRALRQALLRQGSSLPSTKGVL